MATLFAQRGAVVIDADQLAREVVARGTPGLAQIVARFGPGVMADDGTLDRKALGRIVFADPAALADLNAITHPRVAELRAVRERELVGGSDVVIHMIPLLVETGLACQFDAVVVVDVADDVQLARLMARDGSTSDAARARIAAQASREQRLAVADYVIDNSGAPDALAPQVDAVWGSLLASAAARE